MESAIADFPFARSVFKEKGRIKAETTSFSPYIFSVGAFPADID